MGIVERVGVALLGMSGLVICAVATPAVAAAVPSRQPATAASPLAVAGRSQQATERSWHVAQMSQQVKTWSRKAAVTEVPAAAPVDAGGITVFPDSGGSSPIGIVAGSDGALWYTNGGASPSIGRITPAGKITHYTDPRLTRPFGIAAGSDDALWFTNGGDPGSIGRITTSGVLAFFDDPHISEPDWIAAGPGGTLWFTNDAGGGYTDPSVERLTVTGTLTTFTLPSAVSSPAGIAAGPDGAMWFVNDDASTGAGSIVRITASGNVTDYSYLDSFLPKDITAGPDHAMWFVNGVVGTMPPVSIDRITTGGVVTRFFNVGFGALGSDYLGAGGGLVEGPDGALWFTDYGSPAVPTETSIVGRMTAAGALGTYGIPGRDVPANEIASGPGNTLWFTMGTSGIGRVSTLAFTSGPRLSGPSKVGKADTCLFGGLNVSAGTVAWLVNGAAVKGAAGRQYTPTAAALGRALSCAVTLKNAGGSLKKTSAAVKVALGAALLAARKPALSGSHQAGKPEAVSSGTWAPAASSYSYQWYLGRGAIAGASSSRYTAPAGDRGKSLHCVVTAHRPGYANGAYATGSVTVS
jgi:virginiamycin B lyase